VKVSTALERLAIGVAALALSFGLIALLSGFFAGRDQAGISGSAGALGQPFKDLGHAHLNPSELHPAYNSDPPTSGAHVPILIHRDQRELSDDQLLEALELGDVVIAYGTSRPPPQLISVQRSLAGAFSPALAAAGQMIVLDRRPGTTGLIGLAWAHLVRVSSPGDPLLRAFVDYWLGRGAP
jgi:hypothetical protein